MKIKGSINGLYMRIKGEDLPVYKIVQATIYMNEKPYVRYGLLYMEKYTAKPNRCEIKPIYKYKEIKQYVEEGSWELVPKLKGLLEVGL